VSNGIPRVEHESAGEMGGGLDVGALHGALEAERRSREISWRQLAREAGVSPSTLTRLGNGYRPDVDAFAKLVRWLGVSAERFFISEESEARQPGLVTELAPLLRARRDLSVQDVAYLEDLIGAAERRFHAERKEA
jgi:transcriptional regulator with XRE-family HTH domain